MLKALSFLCPTPQHDVGKIALCHLPMHVTADDQLDMKRAKLGWLIRRSMELMKPCTRPYISGTTSLQ